ncbi:hypothetical protein, partial [Enterobacter kobei]|uniref:hypothetical protein n=1 Tax=Enterobacter kobei TaxID=208224 RepID=UPI001F07E74D
MAPVEVAIRRSATAVAKSTPGAIGSRETRSGEFCRGMMLFMSYFSRSARTVYGWVFPDHGGKAQNAIFSFP